MMLFKKLNIEFSVGSNWHSLGSKTTTMPSANCAAVFFRAAQLIPYFTVCASSAIFDTSQSICANRQNIVFSII